MLKKIIINFFIFFIFIYIFLFFKQIGYYNKGKKSKDYIKAIDNYIMVIYMHVPFSLIEKRSMQPLLKIADMFDKKNEIKKELYVYERLRSAILGTRWFSTPHNEILIKVTKKIAYLRAKLLKKDGYKKSISETEKEMLYIMTTDLSPNSLYAFIGIVSFFSFIGITVFLIFYAVENNKLIWKKFLFFLPSVFICWMLWIIMMFMA